VANNGRKGAVRKTLEIRGRGNRVENADPNGGVFGESSIEGGNSVVLVMIPTIDIDGVWKNSSRDGKSVVRWVHFCTSGSPEINGVFHLRFEVTVLFHFFIV